MEIWHFKKDLLKKKFQIFLVFSSEKKSLNLQPKKIKKFITVPKKREANLDYCPCPRSSKFSS
jgi:hypothetical protein